MASRFPRVFASLRLRGSGYPSAVNGALTPGSPASPPGTARTSKGKEAATYEKRYVHVRVLCRADVGKDPAGAGCGQLLR